MSPRVSQATVRRDCIPEAKRASHNPTMRAAWAVLLTVLSVTAAVGQIAGHVPISRFVEAASSHDATSEAALNEIRSGWREGYAALIIEIARMMRPPRPSPVGGEADASALASDASRPEPGARLVPDRGSPVRRRLLRFLEGQTRQRFGDDLDQWRTWLWQRPYDPHPDYLALKRTVYGAIDPRMRAFFPDGAQTRIRLDEIDWGGVRPNGIPPLRQPKVVVASQASYLKDSHIVFGLVVNGEARAYPKRILAWHEMALDRLGGVDLTIVYCTLCGTVMPFDSTAGGHTYRFGTSGLLYQSNKLMFDEDSNSLWSTFEGQPVVGPLVGKGIRLATRPVVTTTWKAWRTAHAETTVLSIDTGFERDYAEGAAYRDYFANDRLMFQVSRTDTRLRNKDEVLVMQLPQGSQVEAGRLAPVAIDLRLLRRQRVYNFVVGGQRYVVLTDDTGANRVYASSVEMVPQRVATVLKDATGVTWRVTESALVAESAALPAAPRISAQRAFWFGWFAQFPETDLLK